MAGDQDKQEKVQQETENVKIQHHYKQSTVYADFESGPVPSDHYAETHSATLETSHVQRQDPFKGHIDKVTIATPKNYAGPKLSVNAETGKKTISWVNGDKVGQTTVKNPEVTQAIREAIERAHQGTTLLVDTANALIGLRTEILTAAEDGKFSPAEERLIIKTAKDVASGKAKQK